MSALIPKNDAIREIAAAFGMEAVRCQRIRSIYRVVDEDGRAYAIKPFRQGLSSLTLGVQLQRYAESTVPRLLPVLRSTVHGRFFKAQYGVHYICMEWIEGRELDFLRPADRKRAVRTLNIWRELYVKAIPRVLNIAEQRPVLWKKQLDEMVRCRRMAQHASTPFSRLYLRDWEFFYRQAQTAAEALERSNYRQLAAESAARGELVHGDWAHHNLLLRPDGGVSLLDLEYLHGDLSLMNGMDLLMRFLQLNPGDVAAIPSFFSWYTGCHPMPSWERELFLILFQWPTDFWMLGRQYFIERLPRSEAFSTNRYRRKVPSSECWLEWMRRTCEVLGFCRKKG